MKRVILLSTVLFLMSGVLTAQHSTVLSGKVTDKTSGQPLAGVLVTIRPAGENKVVKFTQTSAEGMFELSIKALPASHVLHFSMMGYAPLILPLEAGRNIYDAAMTEKVTPLKEVLVKAPSIHQRGDTVTYIVSNFADVQDRSLADVLKKMPGIEVEKSGAIKYNGVSINKFYIEGKDMLGGRYGIATNNIHQKDVGSVEVMENHQPIKALEDLSFSQNPAINIRLKEDAKARWVGTAKAGAGFRPLLWHAEVALMRFKKKSQTLNTLKSNNTGVDLVSETSLFAIDDLFTPFGKSYRLRDYLSVRPDYLREIDSDRSRFNKTHQFNTNNLWSLGKHYDLTAQITYLNNRLTSDNETRTSHFLEDSTIVTEAIEHATEKQHRLSGQLTLTANTSGYYFRNKFLTDLRWDDTDMGVAGTFPNRQTATIPYRQFSNDLELIKRHGKRAYTVNSYNLYQTKPQHLSVVRTDGIQHQHLEASAFYTNTNTALSFYVRPLTISMKLGVVGVIRSLTGELTGVSDTLGQMKNDVSMRYMNLYASPEVEFRQNGFEAKFDMPASFIPYRYTDNLTDRKHNREKFFLSPRLYMRYHFTSRLSASLSGRYAQSALPEQFFYEGLIMNNYRHLTRGWIDYTSGNSRTVNFGINYRQPLKAFFASADVMRSWSYNPYLPNRYFHGSYLLNTFVRKDYRSDTWMLDGSISKGIAPINGIVSVRTSFVVFNGARSQQGKELPYTTKDWQIAPKITSRFTTWFNIAYELSFSHYRLRMENTAVKSSYSNLWQSFSCHVTPGKRWRLQLVGEHYYNEITKDVSKHLFLADATLTCSLPKGWELNLLVKNIFDRETYAYTVYNELSAISKSYVIRPRNVLLSVFFRF
ncbi:carboxypeptidase regulatory-like domain-containing protein [Tannerella forsythia]|uniref:TonB-dependent receptor n=1 Tax=Tannerella forsythia TaxID=28112 RepID=A0A3P1XEJ8_TANFO|nr:carboxypeptidase regulatory-like domain-containing protein [Tannerella forsythia]RRD57159.1 TonB-dependent receptor [Tannerella forsythia]